MTGQASDALIEMRASCPSCNGTEGRVETVSGQDIVRCAFCDRNDLPLHVGHLVSVADGERLGMTSGELYDDENLAAMCDECNIGLGSATVNPRLIIQAIR